MRKISAAYINDIFNTARSWASSKRFSIYLYCVGIATLIWFLMKFSGSFTSQLPVELHYISPSEEWYVQSEETVLMADVQGFGFSLMWLKISGKSEIDVNLSTFEIRGDESDPFIVVPTEYLLNKVGQLFQDQESIKGLFPNVLKIDLSRVLTKTVPIRSRIVLETENGFKLKRSSILLPSEIKLNGPEFILSKIDFINTKIDTIRGLKESTELSVLLDTDSLSDWIEDDVKVKYKVDVDELTSGSVIVQIESKVEDPQSKVKVLPTKVTVFYQVGLDDYELVNSDLISAFVSLPADGELPEKLKVHISNVPDFVEITRIEPSRVEYLLSKKQ